MPSPLNASFESRQLFDIVWNYPTLEITPGIIVKILYGMDDSVCLLDTPKKRSLQSQADSLRVALKDFERSFSVQHSGRKPSQDEIKGDTGIAAKYKQYQKIREVLSGKLSLAALEARSPKKRKSSSRSEKHAVSSPRQRRPDRTPVTKRIRPDDIDPYDAPSSVTPRPILNAIGPTPQRDGQVLGIFDLLSNPPTRRSDETPRSKRRKIEDIVDVEDERSQKENAIVLHTPSQRSSKRPGDLLDHLTGTPETSRLKHSRTPISNAKKFMLSQFFATPSAVRFTNLTESKTPENPQVSATPLRDRVLGLTPPKTSPVRQENDATPAYLKRSHSFKDRLLSASQSSAPHSRNASLDLSCSSPVRKRTGPRMLATAKFKPKPLSQIAAEMRKREDERHADDEEAMREMEFDEQNVATNGHVQTPREASEEQEQPTGRVWKKKGQKRQTRRAVLRPNKLDVKQSPGPSRKAPEPNTAEEGEDEGNSSDEVVEETQLHPNPNIEEMSDDELAALLGSEYEDDEDREEPSNVKSAKIARPSKHDQRKNPVDKAGTAASTSKSSEQKRGKINPNALSHMNFRSLKIKNKNSKGKGRGGRFGRGRR